ETRDGYASLVEPWESSGVVADLQPTTVMEWGQIHRPSGVVAEQHPTAGPMSGTVRNNTPFVLLRALAFKKGPEDNSVFLMCLPQYFRPGGEVTLKPMTLPSAAGENAEESAVTPPASGSRPAQAGRRARPQTSSSSEWDQTSFVLQNLGAGASFHMNVELYLSVLRWRGQPVPQGTSWVFPQPQTIPEEGLIIGWIDEPKPLALEDLFRLAPKPESVAWKRLYVQVLK
ncbi:MAG: hypothetical protein NTW86_07420, partial [Candidatus Sumerlaeota bacterium]|nr:hypothetical protein [Candidatus Sumerlaeota bacterium]